MNPEKLQDAISLLPEALLTPVDRLRQKKRVPWKSIAAVAACLCLVIGLSFLFPGASTAMDSASNGAGAAPEKGDPIEEAAQTGSTSGFVVEVLRVDQDYAIVFDRPDGAETEDVCIQMSSLMLTYENLEEIPQLQPGQTIRIYYEPEEFDMETMTVKPYKIEIIEEESQ